MLVGCAKHGKYAAHCMWCVKATEVTRAVLWRKRWNSVKEILERWLG